MKLEQELLAAFEKPIILYDDLRTKIGYFVGLGSACDADQVNFVIRHGRGLVYACITEEIARRLSLPVMSGTCPGDAAIDMAVSVDFKTNSTGISAADRADTIRALADETATAEDFRRPGHMFPIIVKRRESKRCDSVPEAASYLANLVSHSPVAFLCEILNEDGDIAALHELDEMSHMHQTKLFSLSDIQGLVRLKRSRLAAELVLLRKQIHVPDLDFAHECESRFGINRGIYNVIDAWFFEQGVTNIVLRRACILQFLNAQMRQMKPGGTLRFGHGGLTARLREFWSKMSS